MSDDRKNSGNDASNNNTITMTKKSTIWADLPRRLATICIGFPLVWTMLSKPILARIFFMGAHALSLWEFTLLDPAVIPDMSTKSSPKNKSKSTFCHSTIFRLVYCAISVFLATATANKNGAALFHFLLCIMAGVLVWWNQRHCILGLLVVTIPFRAWITLASMDFASTISVLLVVWNCDTGALLAGRISTKVLGLSQRLPVPTWILRISPAKSMEGFLGGILGGLWTAVSWIPALIRWNVLEPSSSSSAFITLWTPLSHRVGLGLCLAILAIVGDLIESAIKRQAHSKDSGSVLPGHGGILDRFDSSLLAVLLYQVLLVEAN